MGLGDSDFFLVPVELVPGRFYPVDQLVSSSPEFLESGECLLVGSLFLGAQGSEPGKGLHELQIRMLPTHQPIHRGRKNPGAEFRIGQDTCLGNRLQAGLVVPVVSLEFGIVFQSKLQVLLQRLRLERLANEACQKHQASEPLQQALPAATRHLPFTKFYMLFHYFCWFVIISPISCDAKTSCLGKDRLHSNTGKTQSNGPTYTATSFNFCIIVNLLYRAKTANF